MSPLRIAVSAHLTLFVLVVTGLLPREVVPFWALALVVGAALVPPKQSVLFFAALIPTFVAIPVTADFDNFNTWRLAALVISLRWFFSTQSWGSVRGMVLAFVRKPRAFPVAALLTGLAILAVASVNQAADVRLALLRIIYFVNVAMVPVVAFALARDDRAWRLRLIRAIGWSAVLVTVVAFIQLASTYVMDVYAFMRIWGEGIQLNQFGTQWSTIAVHMGNTWLAYYGPQLSLRVFSLFTDSHSFPIYLLMALGGVVAFALQPVARRLQSGATELWELMRTRGRMSILWVPLGLLAVILSGTRGIWAASAGLPLVFGVGAWWFRRHASAQRRLWWRYLAALTACYYLLFAVAWPIFISPQFLLSKGDWALLGNRVRSIVDFGETSNAQRLLIWRASAQSIRAHPALGVGIGNFPTVLNQRITLARAGSSAHNVWLHVAAEMGIPALILFIGIWLALMASALRIFIRDPDWTIATWAGWTLIAIPWIAAYLLTDAALFDERALLMFGLVLALARATAGGLRPPLSPHSIGMEPDKVSPAPAPGLASARRLTAADRSPATGNLSPRVSILMAVHNGEAWLGDVLRSVSAQTYPNIEVTLVDNASTDATAAIAARYPAVRYLHQDANIGFWSSMENLLASVTAPYAICLTDVVLDQSFVAESIAALETDSRIGAVQGKIYAHSRRPDGAWERSDVIDALGFRLERSRRVTILGHGERDTGQYATLTDVFGVEGAVPVFRMKALNACRVDGCVMDPDYRVGGITYADDLDLAWRMGLMGWRQVMAPAAIGWHDRSTTKGTAAVPVIGQLQRLRLRGAIPLQKRRLDWSNIRFAIIKNDPILSILRDLPHIVAREVAVFGYTLLFEPAALAECGRFLHLLPAMLRKRRDIQRRIA